MPLPHPSLHARSFAASVFAASVLLAGCSGSKGDSAGGPTPTVADLVLSFKVYEDTNGDEKLTPGESGFLYFDIQNNGDQMLVEVMGTVELTDDRLTGWVNEERYWGMIFPESSNSDPNLLTGTTLYGEEVSLARFDAGSAGTRINGTAELYEPCRPPDYWFFPSQDEWILHWCQENNADVYPIYSGPVSLLIENAPSGESGVSMGYLGVGADTNDNGVAEPREQVTWGFEVRLSREGDIDELTGTLSCVDPYLQSDALVAFDGRTLTEDYDSFELAVTSTLSPDTPEGHQFTCTLDAADAVGDRFTASATTAPVGSSTAQPAFQAVEVTDYFDFTEYSRVEAGMEVWVENIGGDTIPDARATLSTTRPYVTIDTSPEEIIGGDIEPGSARSFDWYRAIEMSAERPVVYTTPMTIEVTDSLARSWSVDFSFTSYTVPLPVTELTVSELAGDGDGVPEPGEMVTLTLQFQRVSYNTPDREFFAELELSTTDPDLRFDDPNTTTSPVLVEDDLWSWSVTTTLLSFHPGGTVPITLTADLYTQFSESYDPVLRMTTTQELTFEVTP